MAKIESILGKVTGTIGNMTFRHQKGLNSTISAKANEVKNPKTVAQATQRMKIRPSQLFYTAFENVLNHSRQGVKIGDDHRKAFMSEVLKNTFTGVPYVVKGTNYFVPGRYPMSKGSLPGVKYDFVRPADTTGNLTLCMPFVSTGQETWSQMVENILAHYSQLQEGDEICFVWAEAADNGKRFVAKSAWFVLDPNNESEVVGNDILQTNGFLYVDSDDCVAGCVIVSRKVGDNYRYSEETMKLRPDFAADAYSNERFQAAVDSYMLENSNAINSPYILQQPTTQVYTNQIRVFDAVFNDKAVTYMASVRVPVNGNPNAGSIIGVFTADGTANGGIINEYGEVAKDGETIIKPSDIGWVGQTPKWQPQYIQQVVR